VKKRRERRGGPEPFDAILARAGESRFAQSQPPIASDVWRAAVGARIAENAVPVSLAGGVLTLRASTSVWAHELSLLSDDIRASLAARGIAVDKLRMLVGRMAPVDRAVERRASKAVPAPGELPADLAAEVSSVADEGLRAALSAAAASNLAWQAANRPVTDASLSEGRRAARAPRGAAGESARRDPGSPACPATPQGTHARRPNRSS
jgi:hypothetical protein